MSSCCCCRGSARPTIRKPGRARSGATTRTRRCRPRIGFFDKDKYNFNPFIASGSIGMCIDEFNGDNFDHGQHGFVGGGYIGQVRTNGRPLESMAVPPGTPAWGAKWKQAHARHLPQHRHMPAPPAMAPSTAIATSISISIPTYKDRFGRPLMRMTIDFHENEVKMSAFLTDRYAEILKEMGAQQVEKQPRKAPYDITEYQTSHLCGGAIMGANPKQSALNKYLQSWDVPNLFVQGASAFPQNAGYNPTGTVGALAFWSAKAIRQRYLKNPGPLVDAVSRTAPLLPSLLAIGPVSGRQRRAGFHAGRARPLSGGRRRLRRLPPQPTAVTTLPAGGRSRRRSASSWRRTSRPIRLPASAPGPTTSSSTR